MSTLLASDPDPRVDRLFALLPAVHRLRDADNGYPLKALLRVIAEQVNVVEDDITQLYDNQFIETAADWAVPYIGDLVGYRPVADAGLPADAPGATQPRVLVPRREVANTIAWRRRKGTLALLEELANGIAGWPARAVEFFRLLGWTQNVNHLHLHRHRTADLRHMESQDLLGGPFERIAHSVDLRRPDSRHTRGRFDIPSVEVFVWRLRSYAVTATPAPSMWWKQKARSANWKTIGGLRRARPAAWWISRSCLNSPIACCRPPPAKPSAKSCSKWPMPLRRGPNPLWPRKWRRERRTARLSNRFEGGHHA